MKIFNHFFQKRQKDQKSIYLEDKPTNRIKSPKPAFGGKRSIRVFVSSTFRDMMEERDSLMTHTWPELRKFCNQRHVELIEVDLRWGISEEQSTRKETLKLCLDEIMSCRPYFIGLLGERYGWVPGEDSFTADLKEEQPWLNGLLGKSVTELEILHGVLNKPDMSGHAFFYFRDPDYASSRGEDYHSENDESYTKQKDLKQYIRNVCNEKKIILIENYSNPQILASLVLEQMKAVIEQSYPVEEIPDNLDREASDHEAFAEIRRHTYIPRQEYFNALDKHCSTDGPPLLVLGDSGCGKSALFANWIGYWRRAHPEDYVFQHYIGGTPGSTLHWKLMNRLMAEIKRWTDDNSDLPHSNDEILRDFPLWLAKARIKAERNGVNFVIILDALNQLEDQDKGRLISWLPKHSFNGPLKLMVSTLPGETLDALQNRSWQKLHIEPLILNERCDLVINYLARFGKKLDNSRLSRICSTAASSNPLFLKILLDDLRVTGTYERFDERLEDYLSSDTIPGLLSKVLARYQRDYEHNHKGLVKDVLGLIWVARRGLSEAEILDILHPTNLSKLPMVIWAPFRAALDESLVDRGGILNFVHDFLRSSVEKEFLPDQDIKNRYRKMLADYFGTLPPTIRSCDELPWLLWHIKSNDRLRTCLLDIDCFLAMNERDEDEIRSYWVDLGEEKKMGPLYNISFSKWKKINTNKRISYGARELAHFLSNSAFHSESDALYKISLKIDKYRLGKSHPKVASDLSNHAILLQASNRLKDVEPMLKKALKINENRYGKNHPKVAKDLSNLACFYQNTNRYREAEPLLRMAIKIEQDNLGEGHPDLAVYYNNLGVLLQATNRNNEAEQLIRKALKIDEESFGDSHPKVAIDINNLASLLFNLNRLSEAEPLMRRALDLDEASFGKDHPNVARDLNNLGGLLQTTNRMGEAEPILRRALRIDENSLGKNHPNIARGLVNLANLCILTGRINESEPLLREAIRIEEEGLGKDHHDVAACLCSLSTVLVETNRLEEAESIMRRALRIHEDSFGKDHPNVAIALNNLAQVMEKTGQYNEARSLYFRALKIDEDSFGKDHPNRAIRLLNIAHLLQTTRRFEEAELMYKGAISIFIKISAETGHQHPYFQAAVKNFIAMLKSMNRSKEQINNQLRIMGLNMNQ